MTAVLERDVTTVLERMGQPYAIPKTGAAPRSKLRWSRLVKLSGAFAVLALGAHAALQDVAEITADNAVISAYTVALRTPIEGVVSESIRRIGDRVDRGELVAEVHITIPGLDTNKEFGSAYDAHPTRNEPQ